MRTRCTKCGKEEYTEEELNVMAEGIAADRSMGPETGFDYYEDVCTCESDERYYREQEEIQARISRGMNCDCPPPY
jgi:hypothetical protein